MANTVRTRTGQVKVRSDREETKAILEYMKATGGLGVGRPSAITAAVLKKLDEAFAIGASDVEACAYAEITPKTLYNFQNAHPEYLQRKEALKEQPMLRARQTVVKDLGEVKTAQWYLERKRKGEFAVRTDITSGDEPIQFTVVRATDPQITEGEIVEDGSGQLLLPDQTPQ